jgi:hypothetical protein
MTKLTRPLVVIAAAFAAAFVAASVVLAFRERRNIVLDAAGHTRPDVVGVPAAAA